MLRRTAFATALIVLVATGSAWAAFGGLPSAGSQVDNDPAAGIAPADGVSGADPSNADVVGGALTAGKPAVPWAIFRQQETGGAHDQAFVRSFSADAWTTRGGGTVGGVSSAAPAFVGSLNFSQTQDAEAPAIEFAGAGRTVPWATWYENTAGTGFGETQIFASRFDNTGDANQGKWIFSGQSRGTGGGSVPIPSLNIHTNQAAENPAIAGGSTSDPSRPGPWVAWQETGANAPGTGRQQIFVERSIGPGTTDCTGVTPAPSSNLAIGGFCWQQVGVERLGADPSLDIDRARDAVEPDIAFSGPNDSVPWVVWYEQNAGSGGLHTNEMVFAAKATAPSGSSPPSGTVDGGFNWTAVGSNGTGVLDTSSGGAGPCAADATAEGGCSLNVDPAQDAQDPRVAAGTMDPASPTVPWVAWDEPQGGTRQIFVSRLVAGRFALANGGAPISSGSGGATRPDITFAGDTPYVSWRESVGGVLKAFYGHFVNAAAPHFVLDASDVTLTPTAQADVREPISSGCVANPFDGDGAACQGDPLGTPFSLFTAGTSPRALFAQAYAPGAPTPVAASAVTTTTAVLNGAVDPGGASAEVSFQFGATSAYGQTTAAQRTGPQNGATPFAAQLSGLAPAATIHYRAVARSDFAVSVGADQTLTTAGPQPGPGARRDTRPPSIKLAIGKTTLAKLLSSGKLRVKVTLSEAARVRLSLTTKLKVTVKTRHGHRTRTVTMGLAKDATTRLVAAGHRTLTLTLTRGGKRALRALHKVTLTIAAGAVDTAGNRATKRASATLRRPAPRRR